MATNRVQAVLSPPVSTQPISQGSTTNATITNPVELEFSSLESRDHPDHRVESLARDSASSSRPAMEDSLGDAEASERNSLEPPKARLKHTPWESLGSWGSFVIFGGCIGILGVSVFISFLWFGGGRAPEAATATRAWLNIILGSRAAQAITLSSLLLRVIVSAQAASCTSLLAALFLERRAVRASQLPHFSVARGINDGPRALLQMIIGSGTRHMLITVEAFLMLILTLTMLGLQFSSTVLIDDLQPRVVVDVAKPTTLNASFTQDAFVDLWNAFKFSGPVFATYGEVLSNNTAAPDSGGVSDTGLKQRALLPLENSENRTTIRSYKGPAVVANSRVACMPPSLEGNLEAVISLDGSAATGLLQGTLDYNATVRAAGRDSALSLCQESGCGSFPLYCDLPEVALSDGDAQSAICIVGAAGDYWLRSNGSIWKSDDLPWAQHSSIFLVLSTNMGSGDWSTFKSMPLMPTEQQDEWVSYKASPMHYVNASMCFVNFNLVDAHVDMAASKPLFEPNDMWNKPEVEGGSTLLYRRFLGTDLDQRSHGERGILTVNDPSQIPISEYTKTSYNLTFPQEYLTNLEWSIYFGLINGGAHANNSAAMGTYTSVIACAYCASHGVDPNPIVGAIFTDTINHTKRAALAMESWLFMQIQASYDEFAKQYDKSENIIIAFTRAVQAPGQCWGGSGCRGFIAVSVLIGIHISCVVWIVILYLTKIHYSRHGNIWHTVSQLQCEELGDILLKSNNAKDDDIVKLVKDSSRDHLMKIGVSADGSRIEAVKFKDDPNIVPKDDSIFARIRTRARHLSQNLLVKRNRKAESGGR
ncbi:hypothetical protein F4801DRAFT_602814 [Xylaria longipes]|nr:hypothetical protein F4801DRAFT_602814 [Xylaria longipes]RYC56424.1 hypothetical protein CHU98_g9789 [Xylaria longipes]